MRLDLIALAVAVALAPGCRKSGSSSPPPPSPPPPLSVTGVVPSQGPIAGGTAVTVNGTGFVGGETVSIGGAACSGVSLLSSTSLAATTPAGAIGSRDVVVSHPTNGTATLTNGFLYMGLAPAISGITPTSTAQTGGAVITINGSNFYAGATVMVAGVALSSVTVTSTQITGTTGNMTPYVGPVSVTVTNIDGQSVTDSTTLSLTGPAPTLTVIGPTAGPAAGGNTLYLVGSGFAPGATVTVGGGAATVTRNLPTSITITTPNGTAGLASITVTNPDTQSATLSNAFRYWGAPPSLTGITPTSGPNTGGTVVTLSGSGFVVSPVPTVEFAGVAASVSSNSATQIICTTPAINQFGYLMIGAINVAVVNPDGQGSTLSGAFTATGTAPTITSFTPTSGSTGGGTRVTITGTGFDPILDGSTTVSAVHFGSTSALAVDVRSSTQIVCWSPPGTGSVNLTVTNADGGSATSSGTFGYVSGPGTTGVSPTSGVLTGGTSVTVTGTGFAGGDTVTFAGTAATGVTVVSATQITCTTPAGPIGAVDVTVTSGSGVASALPRGFTYVNGVNTQTAAYTWDTSAGIDCRNRLYLNCNVPSFLKDLQNCGLQGWGSPGDTTQPPANLPLVDQYALDWARAYVLRTINIVYGRQPTGQKISGQSINITFVGLLPATGAPGCATPSTDWATMCFGGCHPSGAGHPYASQTGCNSGVLGRAQFDNADSIACNSYAEVTCNNVYHGCTSCSVHNGVFPSLINDIWGQTLAGNSIAAVKLQSGDQQYLDGTTGSGTRFNEIHAFLQAFARRIAFVAAHEIGHTLGLSANGASGPCTVNLSSGQCGTTPGHNNCCSANLMTAGISVASSVTFTDYTKGLSGNPDPANPAKSASCSVAGQSSWAVLMGYLGLSP